MKCRKLLQMKLHWWQLWKQGEAPSTIHGPTTEITWFTTNSSPQLRLRHTGWTYSSTHAATMRSQGTFGPITQPASRSPTLCSDLGIKRRFQKLVQALRSYWSMCCLKLLNGVKCINIFHQLLVENSREIRKIKFVLVCWPLIRYFSLLLFAKILLLLLLTKAVFFSCIIYTWSFNVTSFVTSIVV